MAQKEQVLIVPFPHNNKSLPGLPGNINIFPDSDTLRKQLLLLFFYYSPHSFSPAGFLRWGSEQLLEFRQK